MKSRVLLVDDSEIETMALKAILEERAYEVTVAHDGIEAMELIRQPDSNFEIIIVDWLMPGIDGVQLCINIRHMNLKINPFIMILTSNQWDGAEYTALTCGADDFLEKPFDTDKLCARLLLADRIVGYQRKIEQLSDAVSAGSMSTVLHSA